MEWPRRVVLVARSCSQHSRAKWPGRMWGQQVAGPQKAVGIAENSHHTQWSRDTFNWYPFLLLQLCLFTPLALLLPTCHITSHQILLLLLSVSNLCKIMFLILQTVKYSVPPFPNDLCSVHSCFKYITLLCLNTHLKPIQNTIQNCWNHLSLCIPLTAPAFLLAAHCPHI